MKKGLFLIVLCLILLFSGCGEKKDIKNIDKSAPPQEEQKAKTPAKSTAEMAKMQEIPKPTQDLSKSLPDPQKEAPKSKPKPIQDTSKKAPQQKITQKQPKQSVTTPAKPPLDTNKKCEIPKKDTVTLSIIGSNDMGTILTTTEVVWNEADTAFSILQRITREKKIQMEFSGSGSSVYVEGINNLYEFDKGSGSGWIYRVNGVLSSKSAGAHKIKPGDQVVWSYTLTVENIGE